MSLPYSVIPTILELGIITALSQIMRTKKKEVKVVFSKLFHDTIESDTEFMLPLGKSQSSWGWG